MKQYMKILKNDKSFLSLHHKLVDVGEKYEILTENKISYRIAIPGKYHEWAVSKKLESEYYVIVGEHQPISLIGV